MVGYPHEVQWDSILTLHKSKSRARAVVHTNGVCPCLVSFGVVLGLGALCTELEFEGVWEVVPSVLFGKSKISQNDLSLVVVDIVGVLFNCAKIQIAFE